MITGNAADCRLLGQRFESWLPILVGGAAAMVGQWGFEPPT